jgi:hypothetical protein
LMCAICPSISRVIMGVLLRLWRVIQLDGRFNEQHLFGCCAIDFLYTIIGIFGA